MPHNNFKEKTRAFNTGVGKCSCSQTLEFASERDMVMKLRMQRRFFSKPPVGFDKISVPKKACMMREQQLMRLKGFGWFTIISIQLDKYYHS